MRNLFGSGMHPDADAMVAAYFRAHPGRGKDRRAVMTLHTRLPEAGPLHAIAWDPIYAGTLVTRENWPDIPDGRRRVIREWQEVTRRLSEGYSRALFVM